MFSVYILEFCRYTNNANVFNTIMITIIRVTQIGRLPMSRMKHISHIYVFVCGIKSWKLHWLLFIWLSFVCGFMSSYSLKMALLSVTSEKLKGCSVYWLLFIFLLFSIPFRCIFCWILFIHFLSYRQYPENHLNARYFWENIDDFQSHSLSFCVCISIFVCFSIFYFFPIAVEIDAQCSKWN